MAAVIRLGDLSAGHGCFPPTALVVTPVQKTFVNGIKIGVVSAECQYASHLCLLVVHSQSSRNPLSGAIKTFIEGNPAARIGDAIACGDVCAQGSYNTFIE